MWDVIKGKIWPTVFLVGTAAVFSALIGTIIGIFAAWRRGSATDYIGTGSTMLLYSMPDFWLGLLLLVLLADKIAAVPDQRPHRRGQRRHRLRGARWTRPTTCSCRA